MQSQNKKKNRIYSEALEDNPANNNPSNGRVSTIVAKTSYPKHPPFTEASSVAPKMAATNAITITNPNIGMDRFNRKFCCLYLRQSMIWCVKQKKLKAKNTYTNPIATNAIMTAKTVSAIQMLLSG